MKKSTNKNEKFNVLEWVNNQIIEKLEQGVNPWKKEWVTLPDGRKTCEPANYVTGRPYHGINALLLPAGFYLSFNECQKLGGRVKKGAKAQIVVYPLVSVTEDIKNGDGEVIEEGQKYFKLCYYRVFALEDCEGVREIKRRKKYVENEEIATAEDIIKAYAERTHLTIKNVEQDRAYYTPSRDEVTLPLIKQFDNINSYYVTAFHELGHSTGHESRLNRSTLTGMASFGDESYSKEELIAEITAAYSTSYLGIATDGTLSNNAAYLKGWAKHLKGNTLNWFILSATTQAAKAFKYIFNISDELEEVEA